MSRIGEDYIWLAKPARKKPSMRWVGFGLAIPLVMGAVSLAGWSTSDSNPSNSEKLISRVDVAEAKLSTPADHKPVAEPELKKVVAVAAPAATPLTVPNAAPKSSYRAQTPLAKASKVSLVRTNAPAKPPVQPWHDVTIESGETLSLAFEKLNLSYRDSLAIAHLPKYGSRFTRSLKTGDSFKVKATPQGRVLALDFPLDKIRTLQIRRGGKGFTANVAQAEVEHRTAYAVGTIDTSFYADALESGLSDNLIMNLAHIFGWDIDFVREIRAGDRFIVVYDEIYHKGEKIRDGDILAAEFQNQGRDLKAFRYINSKGISAYFAPDGRAMKKPFLRVPLDQFRISSHFSLGRKHPILNTIRRHEGTDYAAPSGTPIKAAGSGRIAFRGRNGGYGNMIEIKHNSRISTRYGHMSRFRSGLGVGSYVRQGQVIGYVGMTGLATGPHLHFEFREYGKAKNPETVALPTSNPLPKKYMEDFKRQSAPLVAQLDALNRVQVASNSGIE